MVKIIWFNVNKITRSLEERLVDGINNATANRVQFIERISPVDTWDYIDSHKIKKAVRVWRFVVWSNFNDSEHAFWVEFGFRRSPVNWSKRDKITIYRWVWANVMQRTALNPRLRQETIDIIKQAVFAW